MTSASTTSTCTSFAATTRASSGIRSIPATTSKPSMSCATGSSAPRSGFCSAWLIGMAGTGLLMYMKPFGDHVVPAFVYAILVGVATLFGAWEGGLVGIDSENKKLAKFHDELVAGKYLILVYVRKHREQVVLKMMREKHPDAELVAIDSHFVNPFSNVRRVSATPTQGV